MKNILFILTLIIFISCQNSDKGKTGTSDKEITNSLIESGNSISIIGNETIDFGEITEGEKLI